MKPAEVVIVEDDPMVAQINGQYLDQTPGLRLAGVFSDGRQAWDHLRRRPADVLVLDVRLPEIDGVELLRRLRAEGCRSQAVMVTAANDPKQVEELLRLGIADYLVKPFTKARFQEAMEKCLLRLRMLDSDDGLNQQAIDQLFTGVATERRAAILTEDAPKGLQPATMELLRQAFEEAAGDRLSCADLASKIGLSRVTVRRYLNHLVERQDVTSEVDYDTGGRPSLKYRLKRKK
ncbi:MAG: response regulator [Deltaproteobacteria bacterium]|jgi:response regulator of citrate/malate metabolism|nr:response regulator [Deltaproteobacteria bacterium]